jgi:hypothetical protein
MNLYHFSIALILFFFFFFWGGGGYLIMGVGFFYIQAVFQLENNGSKCEGLNGHDNLIRYSL